MPKIKMSFAGFVDAQYPWPEDFHLQAGDKGIVLSSNGNYNTAFVEALAEGSFYRGEGLTVAAAETAAWRKYQTSQDCTGHEWESRGYTNGAGFCKHCKVFGSQVFTPEQLGLYCFTCGIPSNYHSEKQANGATIFYCERHEPWASERQQIKTLEMRSSQVDVADDELVEMKSEIRKLQNKIYGWDRWRQ
jgi:hypothetical protein